VSAAEARETAAFEGAKRLFVVAVVAIAGGLAVAGSLDPTTGGVVVVAGWALAIAALHRLGRAGSSRPPPRAKKEEKAAP
jgi:hypothetical protein